MSPKLLLASSSPRRVQLLASLGLKFETISPNVQELEDPSANPLFLVQHNATLKANSCNFKGFILAADTAVVLQNHILGKPKNLTQAKEYLTLLSGKTHKVMTAITLLNENTDYILEKVIQSSVQFKSLTPQSINHYLNKIDPLDKAGAYAIQSHPELVIQNYSGSLNNIIGLPTEFLYDTFKSINLL